MFFKTASTYNGSTTGTTGLYEYGVQFLSFPSQTLGVAVGLSYPGNQLPSILTTVDQGLTWQAVTGFAGKAGGYTLAANTVPDLFGLVAVSRSLFIAAGGYAATPTSYPGPYPTTTTVYNLAGIAGTWGALYTSTNGGTFWTSVPVPMVGALYAISADASGKHVYAVGAPATLVNASSITSVASPYSVYGGTIVYSGNYGQSFVPQAAPIIPGYTYELNTVAVLRGTIAFAAGGSPLVAFNYAFGNNGVIVGTANGGFSWLQQPITSFGTSNSFNTSSGSIPYLYGIAFNVANGTYYGWAVGANGTVLKGPMPQATLHNSAATYLSVQWNAVPMTTLAQTVTAALNGIVWDNNMVGYIYCQNVIMATHNGGVTWFAETPAAIVLQGLDVWVAAHVPTTY